jgi:O-antigen ligase
MTNVSNSLSPVPLGAASHVMGIRLNGLLSFGLALALFATSPPPDPDSIVANYVQVPFLGSYVIMYFDLVVGLGCLALAWGGKFRLDRHERSLYWALTVVILTRVLSLIVAGNVEIEQTISILRYVETFAIALLLANLLSFRGNRRCFIMGIIVGVVIETSGDLLTFVTSGGEARGVWLGVDNYKLQVFLLIACCLSFSQAKGRFTKMLAGFFILLGILSTETRSAVILFVLSLLTLFITRHRAMLKPVIALSILGAVTIVPVFRLLPDAEQNVTGRVDEIGAGGGTIGLRIILSEMAIAAFVSHPIAGVGSGGFARQQNSLYLQINDAYAPGYEQKYDQISTQNTVLGVAAETGTIGLLAYFLWVAVVVRIVLRGIRLEAFHHDPYMLAACVCMLAMLTGDWWGQYSFMSPLTCLLGFVLGWSRAHRELEQPAPLARA